MVSANVTETRSTPKIINGRRGRAWKDRRLFAFAASYNTVGDWLDAKTKSRVWRTHAGAAIMHVGAHTQRDAELQKECACSCTSVQLTVKQPWNQKIAYLKNMVKTILSSGICLTERLDFYLVVII